MEYGCQDIGINLKVANQKYKRHKSLSRYRFYVEKETSWYPKTYMQEK